MRGINYKRLPEILPEKRVGCATRFLKPLPYLTYLRPRSKINYPILFMIWAFLSIICNFVCMQLLTYATSYVISIKFPWEYGLMNTYMLLHVNGIRALLLFRSFRKYH